MTAHAPVLLLRWLQPRRLALALACLGVLGAAGLLALDHVFRSVEEELIAHDELRLVSASQGFCRRFGVERSRRASLDELVASGVLDHAPVGPWGTGYHLVHQGDAGTLVMSLGADDAPGGTGSDADRALRMWLAPDCSMLASAEEPERR